jgi:hypothetical protein
LNSGLAHRSPQRATYNHTGKEPLMTIAPEAPTYVPAEWVPDGPNTALAWRVIDHIIAEPGSWDQHTWLARTECGTTGCFAGWACLLSGDILDEGCPLASCACNSASLRTSDGYPVEVEERATELLGLYGGHAERLFSGSNSLDNLIDQVYQIFGPRPA